MMMDSVGPDGANGTVCAGMYVFFYSLLFD